MTSDAGGSTATCPLCGGPNECRMAAGDADVDHCWCGEVRISQETLARIAPEQRGVSCVCRRCAGDDRGEWATLSTIVSARLARIRRDH